MLLIYAMEWNLPSYNKCSINVFKINCIVQLCKNTIQKRVDPTFTLKFDLDWIESSLTLFGWWLRCLHRHLSSSMEVLFTILFPTNIKIGYHKSSREKFRACVGMCVCMYIDTCIRISSINMFSAYINTCGYVYIYMYIYTQKTFLEKINSSFIVL